MLRSKEAIGQFTTPQNMAIIPTAAANPGSRPKREPATLPKVAPMKKEGTISPPLKPAARVMAVKMIFNRKAKGWLAFPSRAFATMCIPAPL